MALLKPTKKSSFKTLRAPEEGEFVMGTGIDILTGDSLPKVTEITPLPTEVDPQADAIQAATTSGEADRDELEKTQEFVIVGRQPVVSSESEKPAKRGFGRKIAACLAVMALLAAAACIVIAEPWVAAESEEYDGPAEQSIGPIELAVGETASLGIELEENERITTVDLDGELLRYNGDCTVTALGEYFSTSVVVSTKEAELPPAPEKREVVVLGHDFTEQYAELRAKLRDRFGIEKISSPRTELRELRIITVELKLVDAPHIDITTTSELRAGKTLDVKVSDVDREGGATVVVMSADSGIAEAAAADYFRRGCDFVISGIAEGNTSITAYVGYWKSVQPDEYARFAASDSAAAAPELRENEIFIVTETVTYPVSIKASARRSYRQSRSSSVG